MLLIVPVASKVRDYHCEDEDDDYPEAERYCREEQLVHRQAAL